MSALDEAIVLADEAAYAGQIQRMRPIGEPHRRRVFEIAEQMRFRYRHELRGGARETLGFCVMLAEGV